ncbi:hypothetical protein BKA67DRAFT_534442 [Truncatella angustata]|uniref:Uncharacterized protein n=1 Tax=Truncatella angustata TaxID=152316 RepID=A0A9P8ZZZ7_9PEZI|nr:uncharacterized protein BKA67DRAFT_534442 [Truncatella angustata]KAH6655524.1 hypothetical protein BKA67DRAFT_534442 [Truncatella angustata]
MFETYRPQLDKWKRLRPMSLSTDIKTDAKTGFKGAQTSSRLQIPSPVDERALPLDPSNETYDAPGTAKRETALFSWLLLGCYGEPNRLVANCIRDIRRSLDPIRSLEVDDHCPKPTACDRSSPTLRGFPCTDIKIHHTAQHFFFDQQFVDSFDPRLFANGRKRDR